MSGTPAKSTTVPKAQKVWMALLLLCSCVETVSSTRSGLGKPLPSNLRASQPPLNPSIYKHGIVGRGLESPSHSGSHDESNDTNGGPTAAPSPFPTPVPTISPAPSISAAPSKSPTTAPPTHSNYGSSWGLYAAPTSTWTVTPAPTSYPAVTTGGFLGNSNAVGKVVGLFLLSVVAVAALLWAMQRKNDKKASLMANQALADVLTEPSVSASTEAPPETAMGVEMVHTSRFGQTETIMALPRDDLSTEYVVMRGESA